ncbi:MAG: hypothetical protein IJ213_03810 [Bacteroidales bacterium]|nr:hypothetical protein [Bacteroidales bacterium]
MVALYILLVLMCMLYFFVRPKRQVQKKSYYIAYGGEVEHVDGLTRKINDLSNIDFDFEGQSIDLDNYEIFVVDGDSMSKYGIETGNGIIVKRIISDKKEIEKNSIVIYQIDSTRYMKEHKDVEKIVNGFKMRCLLGYSTLKNTNEEIYNSIKDLDSDLEQKEYKDKLFFKLDSIRNIFPEQDITISTTYKDKQEKDYSIHTLPEIYGKVEYIIPKDCIKI